MMNFYEYLQLRTNEAGEIPPTAKAAPAQVQAQSLAPEPVAVSIAAQVDESTWTSGVFGESPSNKNYDGIN